MSGTLPNWLADWLAVERAAACDTTAWRLDLAWPWPPWATVLFVLVAVGGITIVYWHESSSAGRGYRTLLSALRLAAVGLLLVMLTQATLTFQRSGPPSIALVVDRSASMAIADRYDDTTPASLPKSRLDLAKRLLLENDGRLLSAFSENYRLAAYAVAAGTERLAADEISNGVQNLSCDGPGSEATRLGDAIGRALDDARGASLAGIVLVTDGVSTEGVPLAEAAQAARERGVPILAVGIGSDRAPRDVEIADVLVDEAVFVDDLVGFTVQIKATGLGGESAQVVLRRDGESAPLAEQGITLGADGQPQTVFLTHRPTTAGDIAYVVEVAAGDDESNRDNNRVRRSVAVRDEKIRVLLAFGYPSYEFRFLKTLLERDPTIELSTFLQDADPEYAEQDRTALRSFPLAREELFKYDVLVLGDVDPRLVPRSVWPELTEFVAEKGGGAVFIAGPQFLPWDYGEVPDVAPLLPIDLAAIPASGGTLPADVSRGYVVRPTPLGMQLPPFQLGDTPAETEQIWRSLPPLYWLAELDQLKPAVQLLAEHPTHTASGGRHLPIIISQFVGAGKVWFHATDSTWRWRIGVGDVYFARYWVQTIRYLARGKLTSGGGTELSTDRREYQRGEPVAVRLRFRDERLAPADDEVTVFVETPGEPRRRTVLRRNATLRGLFDGSLANLGDGQYELFVAEPQTSGTVPSTRFTVLAPAGEMARTVMDRATLVAAAETTRGKFYTIAEASRLADELPRGRRVPIESLAPLEIWNRWWVLGPFLLVLVGEWVLRRHKGML